jgi:hypothetical protein
MNYQVQDNFFSTKECEKWIEYIDNLSQEKNRKYNQFHPEFSNELWERVSTLLPNTTGGSGRITFVKYSEDSEGMYKHVDIVREKGVKYTGIIYLNDNEGDTVLYTSTSVNITPKKGRLLLFDVSIPHEGLPPKGVKYIIIFRIIQN